jgi:transcriptional regulator with XRE-family HTH domain
MRSAAENWRECVALAIQNWRLNILKKSQKEASELLGMTQGNLSRIESGLIPPSYDLLWSKGCDLHALFEHAMFIAKRDGVNIPASPNDFDAPKPTQKSQNQGENP